MKEGRKEGCSIFNPLFSSEKPSSLVLLVSNRLFLVGNSPDNDDALAVPSDDDDDDDVEVDDDVSAPAVPHHQRFCIGERERACFATRSR